MPTDWSTESVPSRSEQEGEPGWPVRLQELARQLRTTGDPEERDALLGEIWLLLHTCLLCSLTHHLRSWRKASREDLEDTASEKALALVQRIDSGELVLEDRQPAEIQALIRAVAGRGLCDRWRKDRRQVQLPDQEGGRHFFDRLWDRLSDPRGSIEQDLAERGVATALRSCIEALTPRSRRVWYLRAICGLRSQEVAAHPDVGLAASHVDTLVHRARAALRQCMGSRGFDRVRLGPSCFVEVWDMLDGFKEEGTT